MRILVIEDDRHLNASLKMSLSKEGYAVDVAFDGQEGQVFAEQGMYDAILLDVLLPRKNGVEVCRALRQARIRTPVLMLTARDALEDRVQGLDSGADDYLVKPFALQELLARSLPLHGRRLLAGEQSYSSSAGDYAYRTANERNGLTPTPQSQTT